MELDKRQASEKYRLSPIGERLQALLSPYIPPKSRFFGDGNLPSFLAVPEKRSVRKNDHTPIRSRRYSRTV